MMECMRRTSARVVVMKPSTSAGSAVRFPDGVAARGNRDNFFPNRAQIDTSGQTQDVAQQAFTDTHVRQPHALQGYSSSSSSSGSSLDLR